MSSTQSCTSTARESRGNTSRATSRTTATYAYYAAWRDEGILTQLNYDLTGLARVKEGRKPEPTASVIDTQSVKTSTNVPLTSQGTDAGKKIVGRKRGIITDTLGLLLAVTVTAAGLSENAAGTKLLDQAKKAYPTTSKSWGDTGFKNAFVEHGRSLKSTSRSSTETLKSLAFMSSKGAGWWSGASGGS